MKPKVMDHWWFTPTLTAVTIVAFAGILADVGNHSEQDEYNQGYYDGFVKGQNELNETNRAFWLSITDETSENFYRMRDLFTPMYNDSVTVEKAGYISGYESLDGYWISGGFSFWVNHTQVLNSYYFEDKQSYRVVFPMSGMIYVVD